MGLLEKLKEIEFYIVMTIPVMFTSITYKEIKQCIDESKKELSKIYK